MEGLEPISERRGEDCCGYGANDDDDDDDDVGEEGVRVWVWEISVVFVQMSFLLVSRVRGRYVDYVWARFE